MSGPAERFNNPHVISNQEYIYTSQDANVKPTYLTEGVVVAHIAGFIRCGKC
jgi:hypothetical protein